jgi:hypothetical protein
MLDNLRDSASKSPFFQEEQSPPEEQEASSKKGSDGIIFGMGPVQRFVLALLIFMMTFVIGIFCLLITEKIVLPF